MSAIASGKLALTTLTPAIIKALNLGQQSAQNAIDKIADFTVKGYHLLNAGGGKAKFLADSVSVVRDLVYNALSISNSFVVNSGDSFYTIVDMGEVVGTKGEQFIKIVFTVGGKIITAYPVKGG